MTEEMPQTFQDWVADIERKYCPINEFVEGRPDYPNDARVHYVLAHLDRSEYSGPNIEALVGGWKSEAERTRLVNISNWKRRCEGMSRRYREVFPLRFDIAERAFGRDDFYIVPLRKKRKNAGAPDADRFARCVYMIGEDTRILYVGNSKWTPHTRVTEHVAGASLIGKHIAESADRLEHLWCAWLGDISDNAIRHEIEGELIRRSQATYNLQAPGNRRV